jgi:transglutaminase/protease-like cytokinesis protein 3
LALLLKDAIHHENLANPEKSVSSKNHDAIRKINEEVGQGENQQKTQPSTEQKYFFARKKQNILTMIKETRYQKQFQDQRLFPTANLL